MISTANIHKIIILSCFIIFFACNSEENNGNNCFPNSTINVSINLNLASFQNLNQTGGWVYYSGELAGTRGLIIVNTGNGFKAYDRNAPHICPTSNSTLQVQDDILLYCPEDEAKWILTTGEPIEVADRAPVQYFTASNGNSLTVYN